MKYFKLYILFTFIVTFNSCVPDGIEIQEQEETIQEQEETIIEETPKQILEKLVVPENFNFETERNITLSINDTTPFVKYEVYAYSQESDSESTSKTQDNLLYEGRPYNGLITQELSLSTIYNDVYINRIDGLENYSEIIPIKDDKINFSIFSSNDSAKKTTKANKVNDDGCSDCTDNFFLNGDFEEGPQLPTTYNLPNEKNVNGWSTTASDNIIELWKSGFLGVPAQSGTYFAELNANRTSALYQRICTSPGAEISWSVWHRGRAGEDVAVVRIGENLATATVEKTMSTGKTSWVNYSGTYTVPDGQIDTYFIFEAVSTATGNKSVGNLIDNIEIIETVPGNCAEIVNKLFYPTKFAVTTLAFEDQWPYTGDYDFNDLIISYNIETYLNAENRVTQLDFNYIVESIGGSYNNGFGIELEDISPSQISSVTGSNLTEGITHNNPNGTEEGQPNAVIIFFDDSHKNVGLINTISVEFSSPVSTASLGTAPFNPFLIVNKNRNKEIHLPNKPSTIFPTLETLEETLTIKDLDGDYKTPQGLPWAINVTGEYKAPKESEVITNAYNYFANWAASGGSSYPGWYEDKPGYRNKKFLKN